MEAVPNPVSVKPPQAQVSLLYTKMLFTYGRYFNMTTSVHPLYAYACSYSTRVEGRLTPSYIYNGQVEQSMFFLRIMIRRERRAMSPPSHWVPDKRSHRLALELAVLVGDAAMSCTEKKYRKGKKSLVALLMV